jgi:hypothetical protein
LQWNINSPSLRWHIYIYIYIYIYIHIHINKQVLTRMGEKLESLCTVGGNVKWCNHHGKLNGTFLKKIIRITWWSSNSICQYISKRLKASSQGDICTCIFIAPLFTILKRWKQYQVFIDRWIDKEKCCIHAKEYYSCTTKKEICHMLQHEWPLKTLC